MEAATLAADLQGYGCFVVCTADRAIEFCELTLALRTVKFCPEVLGDPTPEMRCLEKLFHEDFSRYKRNLSGGDSLQCEEGEAFVLLEGAIKTAVDLRDAAYEVLRPETIVVYRTVPGIACDYCFSGSAPGTLDAVSDSTILFLPPGAFEDLQKAERWTDVELLWSQLAEFMATTMHPIAMKATMHDVRGCFSSSAAEAFLTASDEQRAAHEFAAPLDGRDLLRCVLAGSSDRLSLLRRSITVNFDGQRPVFGSFRPAASRRSDSTRMSSPVVSDDASDQEIASVREPLQKRVLFSQRSSLSDSGGDGGPRSRANSITSRKSSLFGLASGPKYVSLEEDGIEVAAESPGVTPQAIGKPSVDDSLAFKRETDSGSSDMEGEIQVAEPSSFVSCRDTGDGDDDEIQGEAERSGAGRAAPSSSADLIDLGAVGVGIDDSASEAQVQWHSDGPTPTLERSDSQESLRAAPGSQMEESLQRLKNSGVEIKTKLKKSKAAVARVPDSHESEDGPREAS
eukprot:gnl/TRDRNA2_/TRDRNA2_171613_c1_seq1.p1 gnl/TRDRNA2_/TRDRNA2_171613_c1~~gnl/TRDRNA2_/TRDRNA2_171613_c1_seq1.p1  ORF type:complete len:588 (+),score=110.89 gnl/TRDRNA2_/TRDRNA2_171613_c1_seq1:231-1766(+)